ncbi:hypothetical protein [Ralstonia pseudosolanacearum]|uniref:hypothetical protein n=1 Tax=Ralstonia pseudosolanacearum TaxID=1310165 RepID=UPI003CE8EB35
MTANLSPKPVKPTAVLRWVRLALDLIGRGFVAWLGLMALFCLAIYVCRASLVAIQVIGGVAFLSGIGVAALVDDASQKSVGEIFVAARSEFSAAIGYALGLTLIMTAPLVIMFLIAGHPEQAFLRFYNPALLKLATEGDALWRMNEAFLPALLVLGIFKLILVMPGLGSTFQYHLHSFFGVGLRAARRLGMAGFPRMNVGTLALFYLVAFLVLFAATALAPIAAPVVYAFLSAFSYVAFREIYLGMGENRKVVMAEVKNAATAPA